MNQELSNNHVEQLESMVKELNYLHQVSQRISQKKDIEVLLHEIMESCKEVTNSEASSLLIYDEKENNLYFEVALGDKGHEVKKIVCNMGEGIAGWVAENRKPLLVEDCYSDPRFNPEYDKQTGFRTRSMICVPMLMEERLIGVIQVINKKGEKSFTERDLNLFQILASQCGISIENARLTDIQIRQKAFERELETARMIQENLLPQKLPSVAGLDIAFRLRSAKEIGGDYYNVYKLDETHTLFFICDVSGKSVSAALIVSTICSCMMTYLKMKPEHAELEQIVSALNKVLIESTTEEKFATAWFGLYDSSDRTIVSINSGHNSTFVFRNGKVCKDLNAGGVFLGLADLPYTSESFQLMEGDTIVCFTDGISEAFSSSGELYGDERLCETIGRHIGLPAEELLNGIFDDVKTFAEGTDQSDDMTCGVVKVV
ncbi:MAG: SpoIIE family protein phosphatase [Ignavibacteria bacterium]|nr:SpoIIE family protein phosphatase [Ignavibacteria bacterium]